jgi:ubiquinone/menaquinone biosynthesis C-methylase UbiE
MPDYASLYENEADRYQDLVSHEDYEGNLLKIIESICPMNRNFDVADIGAGTGRVSFLLAPHVHRVFAVEPTRGMREQGMALKVKRGIGNVEFLEGGYAALPLPDTSVDLVIEGWSLLHYFVHFCRPDWRPKITHALAEIRRVLRPDGTIIFLETMGTMTDGPVRFPWAAALYDYFEKELDCLSRTVSTAYRFDSHEQAVDLIGFFFGEETAAVVRDRGSAIVPEWSGVWWKKM